MRMWFIVACLLVSSCTQKDDMVTAVKKFDSTYSVPTILPLLDTLSKIVGTDTNYVAEFWSGMQSLYSYSYLDSEGNFVDQFKPDFKLNNKEKDFFYDANVTRISFKKTEKTFYFKIYGTKRGDSLSRMYIFWGQDSIAPRQFFNKERVIYQTKNRLYTIIES